MSGTTFNTFLLCAALFCIVGTTEAGEVSLGPSIGLSALPADGDPICNIPFSSDRNFEAEMLPTGSVIPDFTLYNASGQAVHAAGILAQGKPMIVVGGSLTCNVFRRRIAEINSLQEKFGDRIALYVIYTVEAHPAIDVSPYTAPPGREWVPKANIDDDVLLRQPSTYGERKMLLSRLQSEWPLLPEVLIDGPCNEFWIHFGQAPNHAYLISPEGRVVASHPWFNNGGRSMDRDISRFFDEVVDDDPDIDPQARFEFMFQEASIVSGKAGEVLTVDAMISNTSDSPLWIDLRRSETRLPSGWESAMCLDVCLPPTIDEYELYLEAGAQQSYTMYFYTTSEGGSGTVTMTFANRHNPDNVMQQLFAASTIVADVAGQWNQQRGELLLFPQPATAFIELELPRAVRAPTDGTLQISILDGSPIELLQISHAAFERSTLRLSTTHYSPGSYFYVLHIGQQRESGRFVISR